VSQKLKPETLPAEILAAITEAENAMLLIQRTAEACNNNSAMVATAQKEHDAAAEALAKAEVEAVLCLDENEQSKLAACRS
jgi:spore coat polysaccharide biosynthesis protein SpsF (cytidylyltransferase family)